MITKELWLNETPTVQLSSDGVITLEPPCEIVMRRGESIKRFDAADTCVYPLVLVGEHAGLVIIIGWESKTVLVADPIGLQLEIAGYLKRLDLSESYDPGGMLTPALHEIPGSDDVLIEYELGLARLDITKRRLTWQAVFDEVSDTVNGISDGAVWVGSIWGRFSVRLSDGNVRWL